MNLTTDETRNDETITNCLAAFDEQNVIFLEGGGGGPTHDLWHAVVTLIALRHATIYSHSERVIRLQ